MIPILYIIINDIKIVKKQYENVNSIYWIATCKAYYVRSIMCFAQSR